MVRARSTVIRMIAKGKEVWIPRSARFKVYADQQRDVRVQCDPPLHGVS